MVKTVNDILLDIREQLEYQSECWDLWRKDRDNEIKQKEARKKRDERFIQALHAVVPQIIASVMAARAEESQTDWRDPAQSAWTGSIGSVHSEDWTKDTNPKIRKKFKKRHL